MNRLGQLLCGPLADESTWWIEPGCKRDAWGVVSLLEEVADLLLDLQKRTEEWLVSCCFVLCCLKREEKRREEKRRRGEEKIGFCRTSLAGPVGPWVRRSDGNAYVDSWSKCGPTIKYGRTEVTSPGHCRTFNFIGRFRSDKFNRRNVGPTDVGDIHASWSDRLVIFNTRYGHGSDRLVIFIIKRMVRQISTIHHKTWVRQISAIQHKKHDMTDRFVRFNIRYMGLIGAIHKNLIRPIRGYST